MSQRIIITILALLVLVVALSTTVSSQTSSEYYIRYAQVIHSNGARAPDVDFNKTLLCGGNNLCGKLTITGMRALTTLSNYIRNRYNDVSLVEQQFFPPQQLQPTSINALSTDIDYTLQSAQVFLRGLFPSNPYWVPYVEAVNASTDFRYSTKGLPSVFVKSDVDVASLESVLEVVVDNLFTTNEFKSIVDSAYATDNCSNTNQRGVCSLLLHQITEYFALVGELSAHPPLANARARLEQIWETYYRYLFSYNNTNSQDRLHGSSGQFLAKQVIQNIENYINSRVSNVQEYSIESDMITALSVSLGDNSRATFTPTQVSTIAIELLEHKSSGAYMVHVMRGSPILEELNFYTFTEQSFTLQCMSANGSVYSLANNTCPLLDFERFVNSSQAIQPAGQCSLDANQVLLLNCPTDVQGEVSHYCALYRKNCPSFACAEDEVLSAVGLQCYSVNGSSNDNYVVRLSQILHRHGARAPLTAGNESFICGTEYECGFLNYQGMQMLRTVGTFLRNRYNNLSLVEAPFFKSPIYNASLIYSRSTFFQRTVQSAAALLHGIFPSNKTFYPAIFTIAKETDSLLNSDYIPAAFGRRFVDYELLRNAYLLVLDKYVTWEQLQLAAIEAHYGNCANYTDRDVCAHSLCDIGKSFQAVNRLSDKPHLSAILHSLNVAEVEYYRFVFSYNASDNFYRRQGPVLYKLVQQMISTMLSEIKSPTNYKMYEYSAHDTTVAPFAVALGDMSLAALNTSYGITYALELLQNTKDNSYHVRVIRGFPVADNSSETDYRFEYIPYVQRCINEQGVEYNATICPLNDFIRFINTTTSTDPMGSCLLTTRQFNLLGCPAVGVQTNKLAQYCYLYRTLCPAYACETNYLLDAVDLLCYPANSDAQVKMLSDTNKPSSPEPKLLDAQLLQDVLQKLYTLTK